MRTLIFTALISIIVILSGCGGATRISGRLDYTDAIRTTAGDSVWVQLLGQEDIGATVLVRPDNTWVYQPKSKNVRAWSGEYPPIKRRRKEETDPVLVVQAVTPTYRTRIRHVNYLELKKQKDRLIRLQYEMGIAAPPEPLPPPPPPPPPRP